MGPGWHVKILYKKMLSQNSSTQNERKNGLFLNLEIFQGNKAKRKTLQLQITCFKMSQSIRK